jgi:hypothetical protein
MDDVQTCNFWWSKCLSHYMGPNRPILKGECPENCPVCMKGKCYPLAPTELFCPEGYQYCSWESDEGGCIPEQYDCKVTKKAQLKVSAIKECQPAKPGSFPGSECSKESPLLGSKTKQNKKILNHIRSNRNITE